MEAMILSGLLAVFGAGAVWATRPAALAKTAASRRDVHIEARR